MKRLAITSVIVIILWVISLFWALVEPAHGQPIVQAFGGPSSITASNAVASILIQAQETIVYPNDARHVHVEITLSDTYEAWNVAVIIPLRSRILVQGSGADGECTQPGDERTGGIDWMTCQFQKPALGSQILLDFTMSRPVGIVTDPIDAACRTPFSVGTPMTVAINGEAVVDQGTVWSPYQGGYCQYFPITQSQ